VVVKVGSSSLTVPEGGGIDAAALERVVAQVAAVRSGGRRAVLVSSGAVAAGLPALGLRARPGDIPGLQVAAAVGQGRLMERYTTGFAAHDLVCGQVLLTRDVLAHRDQYLHAREALARMLAVGVVPVVNENDTVVVDELKLGDNDRLSAIVAQLVGASMLVILTDTPGLFSRDPRLEGDAALIDAIRHTDEILDGIASGGSGPLGSGGVATKVAAARMAAWSGIPTVIAPAAVPDGVARAVAGETIGTWVEPHPSGLPARKLWIAFGLRSVGALTIDAGAVNALLSDGRSLLAAGVVSVEGSFSAGDAVDVLGPGGALVAKGRAGLSAAEIHRALGRHSVEAGGVVIHRDDLVVLAVR
jgi:glutamate 5-kinase